MIVTCYATLKAKSVTLCEAFAAGVRAAGGTAWVYHGRGTMLRTGAAMFYGVRPAQMPLLEQAKAEGRDWYYVDNAYFDATRERYFRITRNRLQHPGTALFCFGRGALVPVIDESDGTRFDALGIDIKPWKKTGSHVLVCPQSDPFMDQFCEQGARWTAQTVARLTRVTDREVRVRPWQANKVEWYRSLPQDLDDCWALVTYSSASAITAMLAGIPAYVTAQDCISRPVANVELDQIEQPYYRENLRPWANVVADNQFSIEEIASGFAWRKLGEQT